MSFLDTVLEPPTYGWQDSEGQLITPTFRQMMGEFFSRLNVFNNKKNWLSFFSWSLILLLVPFFVLFLFKYLTVKTFIAAFIYSMIIMGTHGTIWHHRYCTHNAYTFRNNFWRFFTQNLTLRIIPEEIYVVSHHVHHAKSDQPGDPYNAQGGFFYCFLADVIHQPISKSLSEKDYGKCVNLMKHTGVSVNSFKQYQKYGSLAKPLNTILGAIFNWAFWFGAFYLIGGIPLAVALFAAAGFWAVGVRTFNYEGHAKGEEKHREGIDYNREDLSINQVWPGIVAGEWHNNHHLYPKSARSGFKPYQVDGAWYYIKLMHRLGAISKYNDAKKQFYAKYLKCEKAAAYLEEQMKSGMVVATD